MTTTAEEKAFAACLMAETANLVDQVTVLQRKLAGAMLDSSLSASEIRAEMEKQLRKLVQGKETVQKRLGELTA